MIAMNWTKLPLRLPVSIISLISICLTHQTRPVAAQEHSIPRPPLSTQQCTDQWMEMNGLRLGANPHPDGSFGFISSAEEPVQVPMTNMNWVAARQDAFEKARLAAMREMVAYFKEGIRSDNSVAIMLKSSSESKSAASSLPESSNDEKSDTTKQEPRPKSGDLSPEPGQTALDAGTTLTSALTQQINAASADTLVGVAVAKQCEGLAEQDGTATSGKYSVAVTLLWSTRLQKLAQSMFAGSEPPVTDHQSEPSLKGQQSLKDRFETATKAKPGWMAYELGIRVYSDSDGEDVVIGFAAVPATSLKSADLSRADMIARNYIAEFQRTQVSGNRNTGTKTSYSENGSPAASNFSDGSQFNDKIEVKTQEKQLTGIYPLATWRGMHPESDKPMVVVARAWKRSAQTQAQTISPTRGQSTNGISDGRAIGKVTSPIESGMGMRKGDF